MRSFSPGAVATIALWKSAPTWHIIFTLDRLVYHQQLRLVAFSVSAPSILRFMRLYINLLMYECVNVFLLVCFSGHCCRRQRGIIYL